MKYKPLVLIGLLVVGAAFALASCGQATPIAPAEAPAANSTEAPATEPAVAPSPEAAVVETAFQPETCSICHKRTGATHQDYYNQLYQDGVIQVSDVTYKFTANPDTTIVTFKMTKNGAPISGKSVQNLNIYYAGYTDSAFNGNPAGAEGRLPLKGNLTFDPKTGVTTSTLVEKDPAADGYVDYSNLSGADGIVVVYGYDKQVGSLPARIRQVQFPYAGILQLGKVDYVSAANNEGCENCHSVPYLKHGNIYARVNGDPATDFITCKVCHFDDGEGGHFEWQLLVDNPPAAAEYLKAGEEGATPEIKEMYGYKTTLMNDVHMSHAMEFPYPQSMSNCATCHEGKLDRVLSDANFKVETCKSCHPVTGMVGPTPEGAEEPLYDTTKYALKTIMPEGHDLASDCLTCHAEGKGSLTFKQIHSGYDKTIYAADGVKYSDVVSVSIDGASFADNKLTFSFSAAASQEIAGLDVSTITPTVMVGLYGWDTKDFIIGAHERLIDDNADGVVDSKDQRNLEAVFGKEHPRVAVTSAGSGKWEATADLSPWADLLANGSVKRVEIAVLPALTVNDIAVAVNAPSRTFDLGANDFADKFYAPIVKVDGCNTCHGALATNFHAPSYGGNAVVCRMCHIVKSGASHLEMQSRSLDSYVHAIHMSQQFDVGDIDFADPVQAEKYETEIKMPFPRHGITDCESCHVKGMYEIPSQTASLPGLLSPSEPFKGKDRKIGEVPAYVVGPAARACGGCHRAALINEDNAGELTVLNIHLRQGGYMVEAGENPLDAFNMVVEKIKEIFKY